MKTQMIGSLSAIFLCALAEPVLAQAAPPDPLVGRELAGRLCSSCHATDPEGAAVTRTDIPSFASIARSPNATAERLAGSIIIPHPAMPGIALTRAEIRDLIAYILSLKPRT